MNEISNNFIGIFDSGIGGLSVLKSALEIMPHENYIYFADSNNCPYGKRDKSELLTIGKGIIDQFVKLNPKLIIIACGTMSSTNDSKLKKAFPSIKIFGTYPNFEHSLIPGTVLSSNKISFLKPEGYSHIKELKKVLIIATTRTCKSEYLKNKQQSYDNILKVYIEPADFIVKAVENNELESDEFKNKLNELFKNYFDIDYLVLGCTHFPFAVSQISQFVNKNCVITSGIEEVVKTSCNYLSDNNILNKSKDKSIVKIIDSKLNKENSSYEIRKSQYINLIDSKNYNIEFTNSF